MDNLLLDLPFLTLRAHSLVVGAVLLSIPADIDGPYVDGGSCVVLIINTTHSAHSGNAHHTAQFYRYWTASLWASISFRLSLSRSTVSSRWRSTRHQRDWFARVPGPSSHLSISNTLTSSVPSRASNLNSSAWGTHSKLPSNWTSPVFWHSPSEKKGLSNSQRACWSSVWSVVSFRAMRVRSFRFGRCVPRRLTERARKRPESRGEAHPILRRLRPQ